MHALKAIALVLGLVGGKMSPGSCYMSTFGACGSAAPTTFHSYTASYSHVHAALFADRFFTHPLK